MEMEIKKNTRVKTSGQGKTANWITYNGIVTKRQGDDIYVIWDNMFVEDVMDIKEIQGI